MKAGATGTALLLFAFSLAVGACTGDPGNSCTVTTDAAAGTSTIRCTDGTMATVRNGVGMDGAGCTVRTNTDGTKTIMCDDGTMVTVNDGAAAACSVTRDMTTGVATITCSDGTTATVTDGAAGGACTVRDNRDGTKTITCEDGTMVTVNDGTTGTPGLSLAVRDHHGEDYLLSTGEYAEGVKTDVYARIDSVTADAAGLVTVNFHVAASSAAMAPPIDFVPSVSATIAKLTPSAMGSPSVWVPYIYRRQTVSGSAMGDWPAADGTFAEQANAESSCTTTPCAAGTGVLTNHGDGTYTYVLGTNLSTAMMGTTAITYERNLTHRISIMMGGHSGPTADANFDFRPDTMAVTSTRNIIDTNACKSCHGREFAGHGGNRLSVENCVTCHVRGNIDPNGGESVDFKVMIHRIHMGGELPGIPGADGVLWDNPTTTVDESADNGDYSIWGYRNTHYTWWKVGFPAVIENCTMCHQGTGAQVNNWKTAPSREACGSCHATTSFVSPAPTGFTMHSGGARADDSACTTCHGETDIEGYHAWRSPTNVDPRNVPEYAATMTVTNVPMRGYFIAGEAPVVRIVLANAATPATPIDHTTVAEDRSATCGGTGQPTCAEGCGATAGACGAGDGLFANASFFVHGPRAFQRPVLTTAARAAVRSAATATFDLTPIAGSTTQGLIVQFDRGWNIIERDVTGGDVLRSGTVTVTVPADGGTSPFAGGRAAATPAQIVTWLNGNAGFAARGVAFVEGGRVVVRSLGKGRVIALQLQASDVATQLFAADLALKMPAGSTTSNNISARAAASGAANDPKAVRTAANIEYTLDDVIGLAPGTYQAAIEMTDRGRVDAVNYRTPTVARVSFQVGQAAVEAPVARNCNSCHWNAPAGTTESEQGRAGHGFILDFSRHFKIFDDGAPDQCGQCHDQQPQAVTGTSWSGSRPISRRAHAVHNGSALNYPLLSVDYANGDPVPGRNWDITLPQNVRNCDTTCHTGTTSGTWATRPARLPCSGCHDSDAAQAHLRSMTFDPTPADAWSGDEAEACTNCH